MKELQSGPKVSTVHLERYKPWKGELQGRGVIIFDTVLDGVKHNLKERWVKVLIALAWAFTVLIPFLLASSGFLNLTQEAGEMGDEDESYEMLEEYRMSFPLSEQIQQGETAVYNISLMNSGERPDIITVFASRSEDNWSFALSNKGQGEFLDHINFSLAAGEIVSFEFHVRPPDGLESGKGEIILTAVSQGAEALNIGFKDGDFAVSRSIRTVTVVGQSKASPYHFVMGTSHSQKVVPSQGEVEFDLQIRNTGLEPDLYVIRVEGLPDDWKAELMGLDIHENETGVFLHPGEFQNFTVRYTVPKYPFITNFIAVVATSTGDQELFGGTITTVEVSNIPDEDVTGDVLTGFFTFPILFSILLGAVVGSRAISQDLAQKSFTIYFARPITKLDYLAIKYGNLGATMSLVVLAPMLATYIGLILLNGVSNDYILSHLWVFGAIILYSFIIIATVSTLALVFSSMTPKRFYAAFGFVVSYFISIIIGSIITGTFNDDRGEVISILGSLTKLGAKIFDVPDVSYEYSWGYNLLFLVVLVLLCNAALGYRIWKTELSE